MTFLIYLTLLGSLMLTGCRGNLEGSSKALRSSESAGDGPSLVPGKTSIIVNWEISPIDIAAGNEFTVYYTENYVESVSALEATASKVGKIDPSAKSFVISGLTSGVSYYVIIVVENSNGEKSIYKSLTTTTLTVTSTEAITSESSINMPTGMTLTLVSNEITRQSTASITIDCANAEKYLVLINDSSTPTASNSDWQNCSSSVFQINPTILDGSNQLNIWFSNGNNIAAGPNSIDVLKTSKVSFTAPNPQANNGFGGALDNDPGYSTILSVELANGNIVVADPLNDTNATDAGAVHLFSRTGTLISSINGDDANDNLGFHASTQTIIALSESKFIIVSPSDDVAGITDAGSIKLINGTTGAVIATIAGDQANDQLGSGGVVVFDSSFAIISPNDDSGASDSGSIILVNSTTGAVVATIAGQADDSLGSYGIKKLENGNFVASGNGMNEQGLVKLINNSTGAVVATIAGVGGDFLASGGIFVLGNDNFVIASPSDDQAAYDAGSVKLVNGSTGAVIATILGDDADDSLGTSNVVALENNNFVIVTRTDTVGGVDDAGSVKLVNGSTGAVIVTIAGDQANDKLGDSGLIALANSNFVISTTTDDVGGIVDAGSVKLVDGSTGAVITTLSGDQTNDNLGSGGIYALSNSNFIIPSPNDDVSGVSDAGSVKLVNGSTGAIITTIAGDQANDRIGSNLTPSNKILVLSNDNFVSLNSYDKVGGVAEAGSVKLIDGNTGAIITSITDGHQTGAYGAYQLGNGTFAVASSDKIHIVNSTTGALVATTAIDVTAHNEVAITVLSNGNFIVGNANYHSGAANYVGMVSLLSGSSGAVISEFAGDQTEDGFGMGHSRNSVGEGVFGMPLSGGNVLIYSYYDDVGGITDSGSIHMLVND